MYYTYVTYYPEEKRFDVGVTKNLERRKKILCGQHSGCRMVYYEIFPESTAATRRENQLSGLPQKVLREWVLENNPELVDLVRSGV